MHKYILWKKKVHRKKKVHPERIRAIKECRHPSSFSVYLFLSLSLSPSLSVIQHSLERNTWRGRGMSLHFPPSLFDCMTLHTLDMGLNQYTFLMFIESNTLRRHDTLIYRAPKEFQMYMCMDDVDTRITKTQKMDMSQRDTWREKRKSKKYTVSRVKHASHENHKKREKKIFFLPIVVRTVVAK